MSKTQINARLHLASKNAVTGDILYTFILTFPRIILPEVLTHRMFSRNTASSRAVPAHKMRERVITDPFIPTEVGQNKKGMQAGADLPPATHRLARFLYGALRFPACFVHAALEGLGVHKQITNRVLEPWQWTEQICSMTEIDNFLELRNHPMAEPHFHILAKQMDTLVKGAKDMFKMMEKYGVSSMTGEEAGFPNCFHRLQIVQPGGWHLPFAEDAAKDNAVRVGLVKSAARCARVSYYLHENGELSTYEKDLDLYQRLSGSNPKHLSPFEHQAQAAGFGTLAAGYSALYGNYRGWQQLRWFIEQNIDPTAELTQMDKAA